MKKVTIILTLFCVAVFAQRTFTDSRDGKKYKTMKIGKQTWMAENLNYEINGSLCLDDNPTNCNACGRLYSWQAADNIVCPKGWHLPSDREWDSLVVFVGAEKAGKKLKSKNDWNKNNNGTDEYGFSALPCGYGFPYYDRSGRHTYSPIGYEGYWWSATEVNVELANVRRMDWNLGVMLMGREKKISLYSVRCVKN